MWKLSLMLLAVGMASMPAIADCEAPYMRADVSRDLGDLTSALRGGDQETFEATAITLEENLACVRVPLPPIVFATAYRYIATYYYRQGDQDTAARWIRTSLEVDPGFAWDVQMVAEDDPIRGWMVEMTPSSQEARVEVEGWQLNVPVGSTLMLDGRPLNEASATLDRPHLLQMISTADQSVRQVFLIEGNAIPEQFLSEGGAETESLASSSRTSDSTDLYEITTVQRFRPRAKTPLMVAGGVTGLAAGGLYFLSSRYRQDFEIASTTDDLEEYAQKTNTMVILSGLTLAVGLGIEVAGIRLGFTGNGLTLQTPL